MNRCRRILAAALAAVMLLALTACGQMRFFICIFIIIL